MRLRALVVGLLMSAGTQAQDSGWSLRSETLLYDRASRPWSDSAFRRLNTLPDHSLNAEWRPDLAWHGDTLSAMLRPRLGLAAEPGSTQSDAWINEAWLRWRVANGLSLQAGREALLWGPGNFWNPSNPFFPVNNKANPKREIAGHDFLRGRWQWSRAWSASLISQLSKGHAATDAYAARRDAIKLDWTGQEASAAALVSARPGQAPSWSGWISWTASDALLLYGEAAWRSEGIIRQASPAATPTAWAVQESVQADSLKALLGAAWTFDSNWTLSGELWRNGAGLDAVQARTLTQAAQELAEAPRGGLADSQLAALMSPASPLRRHYAGLQFVNGTDAHYKWTLRYTRNLDDQGGEAFIMLKHDIGDSLQLWGNLMARHGSSDSEYGRWISRSAMLGVSWYH